MKEGHGGKIAFLSDHFKGICCKNNITTHADFGHLAGIVFTGLNCNLLFCFFSILYSL